MCKLTDYAEGYIKGFRAGFKEGQEYERKEKEKISDLNVKLTKYTYGDKNETSR